MRERILDNVSEAWRYVSGRKGRNLIATALLVSGSLVLCAPLLAEGGLLPVSGDRERVLRETVSGEALRQEAGTEAILPGTAEEGVLLPKPDRGDGLQEEAVPENTGTNTVMPEQQPVSLIVSYGYENSAKGGRCIPVNVTIRNQRNVEEEVILRIKSVESDGSIYCYDYDVALEPLEEQSERYHIPVGTDASQLFLELNGREGEVLASRLLDLNVSRDVPELFIGVLSDDLDGLDYLNGIGINYSALRTRTFSLDPEEFPEEEVGLDLLDVLVVNNFKLRDLSEEQTSAIMDWVHGGGVLLLGTGERVGDTLGRFAPELLDDSYGTPALRPVNLSEDFVLNQPGDGMMELTCVDIPLHGGNVILSSGGFPLLTAASKEQGLIGVAGFDMTEIRSFCQNNPSYVDYFFSSLLGESRINRLADVIYSGNSEKFWSVQSLINTGNVEKLPNLPLYAVVVTVYLAVLGPGMYLFLKKRDQQIWYRRGVVVLSLVFAIIVYWMGAATRFRSTFYTYATIQDVTEDYVTDTTYVNIRNPYNRSYRVELNPSYSVLPITRSYQQNSGSRTVLTGQEPNQVVIERGKDRLAIRGTNISAFSPRYFQMERKSENTNRIGITGEVDYFEGNLSGSITNCFPFPLENVTFLLYGNMVLLGRLEPGESCRLEDLELLRFPLNNSYVVAEQIIGEELLGRADIGDTAYLQALERCNILTFYLNNYMSTYNADARVIAFSTEKEESLFLQEIKPETYGHMMLTSQVPVNTSHDRMLYRSVLIKTPKVINGNYFPDSNSMNGMEPLTLEYQMGTEIDVESLTFEPVSDEFLGQGSGSYIEAFSGSVYFYNHRSGNFDLIEMDGKTMYREQLQPYLSPGNTLTVRYVYDGPGSYHAVQLPMPMAAGRER